MQSKHHTWSYGEATCGIRNLIYNWRFIVFSDRLKRAHPGWEPIFTVSATTSSDYLLFPLYMTLPSLTFSCLFSGSGSGVLDDEMRIGGTRDMAWLGRDFLDFNAIHILTL
jgi:hypothetical protein